MKKLLLFAAAACVSLGSFAQNKATSTRSVNTSDFQVFKVMEIAGETAQKTSGNGDTVKGRLNFSSTQLNNDSLIAYRVGTVPYDSGYVVGPNPFGDKGWAERFDISSGDSSVRVIGTYAIFDGNYNTGNNTIAIKVWRQGARTSPSTKVYYNGFPGTVQGSTNFAVKNLGINRTSNADTLKYFALSAPTAPISDSFFVGFEPNYAWSANGGDTISLKTTRNGYRYSNPAYLQGTDTILNVQNATKYSDDTWHDNYFDNFQLGNHLCVFPVFVIQLPSSVNGITKNNLTFFGNFPNPASDKTTVKFSLKNAAEVTLTLTDMSGRTLRTINTGKLSAGVQNIALSTADLAAGNYIYMIRTSEGDGMGAQLTVIK